MYMPLIAEDIRNMCSERTDTLVLYRLDLPLRGNGRPISREILPPNKKVVLQMEACLQYLQTRVYLTPGSTPDMSTMQSVADRLRTQPLMLVAEAFTTSNDRRTGRSTSIQHALESCLRDESGFRASVPSLNVCGVHNIAEGGLVRFVGMIQDVRDTEFYAGIYEEHMTSGQVTERTGKYRDVLNLSDGATFVPHDDCTWQRTPMVCVPVPGLTTWAMEALVGPVSYPNDHRQPLRGEPQGSGVKRRAEPEFATGDQLDTGCVEPMEDDDESTKRPRSDAAALMCPPCADTKPPAQSEEAARKLIWERSASGMGCLLKVYDADEGEAELRVNDVVEVFGVVERGSHAEKAANDASAMEMLLDHERALQPPPSCQPRLHCFYVRRLPADCHPLLPEPNTKENALAYDGARAHAANLRGSIIAALSSALGGDKLVAEYVLLSSISRILVRHGEKPIGKLSVNITGCPPCANGGAHSPVTAALGGVLQELLPYAITMGMSIGELNSRVFGPFKDHEANALKQGCLQLPTGAVLLLDETVLAPGQLREQGVRNVRALADLLERQKVAYDFTYCSVDFLADVAVLSVSAAKSMLMFDCSVPLRVQAQQEAPPTADASWLSAARAYLGLAARAVNLSVPPGLSEMLQDDFVRTRASQPNITPDDFSRWLTCARLHAASQLSTEVTQENYAFAKELDQARRERQCAQQVEI